MADTVKDTPKQAALRIKIENHAIWQYPPAERLSHQREWQDLFILVFDFDNFYDKVKKNVGCYDSETTDAAQDEQDTALTRSALQADEQEMLSARYTSKEKLRKKMDTVVFTESLVKAVSKFDTTLGKPFIGYFQTIYVNAMYESVNRQANREQGDVRMTSKEGRLWKGLQTLCERQNLDPRKLSASFQEDFADALGITVQALRNIIAKANSARYTFSLDEISQNSDDENGTSNEMANPNEETPEQAFERSVESMRLITEFARKEDKEYPRYFFTNDILKPLCEDSPSLSPDLYCEMLEKSESLLWHKIFVLAYIDYLFVPEMPRKTRTVLDLKPVHPMQDSSIAAQMGRTPAAISVQRKLYRQRMAELKRQLDNI